MAKGIAEATTKIYEQLEALPQEERLRAVRAALTMLGEPMMEDQPKSKNPPGPGGDAEGSFCEKANGWIKKNGIRSADLEQFFHADGGKVDLIIGKAIGRSKRAQTVNTYILTGLAAFLATGSTEFADEVARTYCQHLGCYDSPNHSNYVKAFGNKITGSKASGWKLTAPGLTTAAELIQLQSEDVE